MQSGESMTPRAGVRLRNGPHGVDTAWPKPPREMRSESPAMVRPLARGLSILSAFGPGKAWLSNQEIAFETDIPAPTVIRLLRSLVALGYLYHDVPSRKYALAPAALALGYAAVADPHMLRIAGEEMRKFAEATETYVLLGTRDRLTMVLLDTQISRRMVLDLRLFPGMRVQIAYSVMGWALLAALPEEERRYLQQQVECKAGDAWPPSIRRRMSQKIAQARELGFCMLHREWDLQLACVAAPVLISGRPPLVLCCVGRIAQMSQARMELELGPRLVATAQVLRDRLLARS